MESTDTDLAFAIDVAKTDPREAPWYGVWNIILTQKLFNGFCKKPCSTITYPQFPLTSDVDTYDSESEDEDGLSDEEEEVEDLRFSGGDIGPLTPPRPVAGRFQAPRNARRTPIIRDTDAPSPEDARASMSFLPATPLRTPASAPAIPAPKSSDSSISSRARRNLRSPSAASSVLSSAPASMISSALSSATAGAPSGSPSMSPSAPHLLNPKKSTRIPDFVQLVFRPSTDVPSKFERMVILLVEIKKRYPHNTPTFMNQGSLAEQVHAQAYHAFAADKSIRTVGIIVALGDAWTYKEYDRQSAWSNFTYQTPDDAYKPKGQQPIKQAPPAAETYPTLDAYFSKGYAILSTPESDLALAALRRRMDDLKWK